MDERKIVKCKKCDHIHWQDESHECPTPEYYAAKQALMDAWLDYEETHWFDENGVHVEH